MIDVAIAIDAESVPIIYVEKARDTYDVNGNVVFGPETQIETKAAIQPVSGSTLRDLPEGVRDLVSFVCWSRRMALYNDKIIYRDVEYRILHVWERPMDVFSKFAIGRLVTR